MARIPAKVADTQSFADHRLGRATLKFGVREFGGWELQMWNLKIRSQRMVNVFTPDGVWLWSCRALGLGLCG